MIKKCLLKRLLISIQTVQEEVVLGQLLQKISSKREIFIVNIV